MRYQVTVQLSQQGPRAAAEPKPIAIDVDEPPDGSLRVRVNGRPVDLDIALIGAQRSVRFEHGVVDLTMRVDLPNFVVTASGLRASVRVDHDKPAAPLTRAERSSGPTHVRSPMAGRVAGVLVAAGDTVQAGQPFLVIEAMKMENEVRAAAAGVVLEVHVKAGAAVEANAVLLTLK